MATHPVCRGLSISMSGLGQQIKHPLRSQQGLEGAEEDQDQETEVQKGLNTFKALRNNTCGCWSALDLCAWAVGQMSRTFYLLTQHGQDRWLHTLHLTPGLRTPLCSLHLLTFLLTSGTETLCQAPPLPPKPHPQPGLSLLLSWLSPPPGRIPAEPIWAWSAPLA